MPHSINILKSYSSCHSSPLLGFWKLVCFFVLLSPSLSLAQGNNPDKYLELGREKFRTGKYKDAIADFSIVNDMLDGHVESVFMLVKCKYAIQDTIGALKECDQLIELEKNNASFYNNRGNLKDELNEPEQAILDYDKAINLKPDYANAYYNRAIAYYNIQEFEKSKEDFEKVIKLTPKDAESWYGLGLTHLKRKAKDDACKAFKNAKELSYPNADKALEDFCK